MDESVLLLGRILGQIYRTQSRADVNCGADDAHIYGLLNGFENAIEEELESIGYVSRDQIRHVMSVLEPIWSDPARLKAFRGYYDIEKKLEEGGIDRAQAIKILRYLRARGQFAAVIAKMDSSDSPAECRTFELSDFDK